MSGYFVSAGSIFIGVSYTLSRVLVLQIGMHYKLKKRFPLQGEQAHVPA